MGEREWGERGERESGARERLGRVMERERVGTERERDRGERVRKNERRVKKDGLYLYTWM